MANILVVDDEESIVGIIRSHLASMDHTVVTASNGREALDRIRATPIDLIITDIYMPEMDGIELITSLRRIKYTGAILALSGGGTLGPTLSGGTGASLTPALLLGAGRTLAKPFTKQEFLDTVEALLADGPCAGTATDSDDRASRRTPRSK